MDPRGIGRGFALLRAPECTSWNFFHFSAALLAVAALLGGRSPKAPSWKAPLSLPSWSPLRRVQSARQARRIGVITSSGGLAGLILDTAASADLRLPPLSPVEKAKTQT